MGWVGEAGQRREGHGKGNGEVMDGKVDKSLSHAAPRL